uniref:ABC-type glutathione-S-conjugate transporter n=1 Tax=Crassostrea virginica TaxID=6565 RepID=A0A8B8D6P6_CRAVI|nr:multidrug resistance-associated protein 1-like isoform X1 [Crassostrea virginica]XP_022323793.1 multidrug resistance-associated protein 1-like isoform X1 [Crassostrea virginica]XP_022323794.1 multidrug resistance-associated protein 1-like isoform X1 [Crassostrea virginica]
MGEGFEEFCNGTLWNETLLLYNDYPQFTDCFQNTLLVWVPCGFLWATLPFYLPALLSSREDVTPVPLNWLNVSKSFLSLLLAFLAVVDLIQEASADRSVQITAVFVALAIKVGSYMLSAVLIQLERGQGYITSGVLFVFFLLMTVAGIIPFYSYIEEKVYDSNLEKFVLFYISWSFLFIQLILHCIAEKVSRRGYYELGQKPCPETKSSILGRLTYWWINSLITKAYKKDLTEDDLFDLNPRDASDRVVPQFAEPWEKELAKHRKIEKKSKAYSGRQDVSFQVGRAKHHLQASERTPLVGTSSRTYTTTVEIKDPKKKKQEGASLFKVLARTYGPDFLKAWGCKFIYDLLQMASPSLLSVLIGYVESKNTSNKEYEWKGYVFALGFFLIALLQSTFFHQNFHIGMTLGMRIRSALIAAVYKKSLTMNNEARKTSTVGEIVNLMSVDCQRMQDLSGYLWMIWSAPVQITLAMYLLWVQLGPSVLAGLGLMLLLIPFNAVISMKQRKLQVDLMKFKDKRLKLMSEVLSGMKVLKLYAWEPSFQEKIAAIRDNETRILKKNATYSAFSSFSFTTAPFLVTLVTFLTYVFTSDTGYLSAQKAFTSLALFNILRFPINLLPMMISYVVQANVSIGRISAFLKHGDLDPDAVQHEPRSDSVVSVENGIFSWDSDMQPALRDINLKIPSGKLVAVVGQVGSGKSSLLSALLGEMDKLSGRVNVHGKVAYVPQQAWIQNATVRDNILFGKGMEDGKYEEILNACALKTDLEILTGGDMTEIGEKGINLSGGQKQRVSLARAVYNNADIYMLDDPLSAVDSHVGKHIFQKVVGNKGLLRHKTRIMVTHGIHWLPMVDSIIVLIDGKISEMGTYDELLSHDGAFAQFLKTYLTQENPDEEEDEEIEQMKSKILQRVESVTSDTGATSGEEGKVKKRKDKSEKPPLARSISTIDGSELKGDGKKPGEPAAKIKDKDKLIQEEKAEKGTVKWKVFMMYFRAIGLTASAAILIIFIIFQVASVGANIWLSIWTNDKELSNISLANTTEYQNKNNMYLGVYAAFGVIQGAVIMVYTLLATYKMVDASRKLHNAMLDNVMRAPMSFFDTTPTGRIVNRFSRDVETTDSTLPMVLRMWLNMFFSTLSTFAVISYSTPLFLTVIIPVLIFYVLVQRFYVPTSRQLQRIESTTRSPIFNHFSESLNGASSIRAYHEQERFINESLSRVDKNILYYFARIASNRWLGWRLEFVGNLIVFAAAIFAVVTPNLSGGLVGLSVSYALQVTSALNMLVRQSAELETNVVSVERLKEYSEVDTEDEWIRPFRRPPHDWPADGGVVFHDYKTRYREGLDLVLRGISFQVLGGQKVGIVGRTGAGKSSLTVALFRLIESAGGQIVIDGQRISDIGLHDLRGKLTILPQDPVLFSGTLRMNIDPFNTYTDENIWHALEHSHLKAFVENLPDRLQHECGEGGQNLSVGQRQLVCLARTLLRKSKILILDEATAAVDMETDDLIQKTIRTEFSDSTVLTIAHRLNTIMDYDKVLVLDQGLVKEYDSPENLLKNKSSAFYGMAKDANLV